MSTLTVPFSTTCGTSTEPSTTPCSLTESEALPSGTARTLPVTPPSMCNRPVNSMSHCTRAERPIRVSMLAVELSRCLNMMALSGDVRIPDKGLSVGCHALAHGSNFDRDAFRLEIGRQGHGLFDTGEVAEAVRELPGLAGGEGGQIDAGGDARALPLDGHGEHSRAQFLGARRPGQRQAHRIIVGPGGDPAHLEISYAHSLRLLARLRNVD